MSGESTLDLSAVNTLDNFQDELPKPMRAFQDLLPPPSPPPSPAAIPHSNKVRDHKEEDNNTDHTREAALQNFSYNLTTASLDDIRTLDQNHSLISLNAASSHVLPLPPAPSNPPVVNPLKEIVSRN
jgi:hypothetical protein